MAQVLISSGKLKRNIMSKENSYPTILARAKKLMSKGQVTDYIRELLKVEQLRSTQGAI